jgi:hypothetical protein
MKRPLRYRGRTPIPVSSTTMAGILTVLARSGKQGEFMKDMAHAGERFDIQGRLVDEEIKFDLSPKTVNLIKSFSFNNKLHEGNEDHNRFVADVIYSPPEGCPEYQKRHDS